MEHKNYISLDENKRLITKFKKIVRKVTHNSPHFFFIGSIYLPILFGLFLSSSQPHCASNKLIFVTYN